MITSHVDRFGYVPIHPKLESTNAINKILRGELSAINAYEQILEKIESPAERKRLTDILRHHLKLAEYWQKEVRQEDMLPDDTPGPWGFVVKAFVGTAKVFGNTAALKAMKEGEEHGQSEYDNLLKNQFVDEDQKRYVRQNIIPDIERHIASIDAMVKMQ